MNAEIIAVGEEVLAGDTINTNAAVISRKLADIGVFCRFHSVVGDIEEDIVKQLRMSSERSQVIVLCGGLGPTEDDLTKESVATFLNRKMIKSEKMMNHIKNWFSSYDKEPTENNFKQGLIISGGEVLKNNNGTACGVYIVNKGIHIFLLPGPPRELIPMLNEEVIPIIKPIVKKQIVTKTYRLVNIGESLAVTVLADIMQASDRLIVASYAKVREVHIKITAIENNKDDCLKAVNKISRIIEERMSDNIFTDSGLELEEVLVRKLGELNKKIGFAESCTGGMLASTFVNVSGASSVFNQGFVTYSNESKSKLLGVKVETLNLVGAVSSEVAYEMAKGLETFYHCDYGLSITGIAGPEGGTDEKPVGLVYIGLLTPKGIEIYKEQFRGNREKIREQAAKAAMVRLWLNIKG